MDGHEIMEPANGAWYQTSEAVMILYELKLTGARILSKIITRWLQHTPPQIGMKHAILMRKVQHVEKAVAMGFSADDALQGLVTDRVTMNEAPSAGANPVMRRDEFVNALKQHCRHEQAASKETAAAILAEAKAKRYSMKGLCPSSGDDCSRTVGRWWQNVGGADLTVRGKESLTCKKRPLQSTFAQLEL